MLKSVTTIVVEYYRSKNSRLKASYHRRFHDLALMQAAKDWQKETYFAIFIDMSRKLLENRRPDDYGFNYGLRMHRYTKTISKKLDFDSNSYSLKLPKDISDSDFLKMIINPNDVTDYCLNNGSDSKKILILTLYEMTRRLQIELIKTTKGQAKGKKAEMLFQILKEMLKSLKYAEIRFSELVKPNKLYGFFDRLVTISTLMYIFSEDLKEIVANVEDNSKLELENCIKEFVDN